MNRSATFLAVLTAVIAIFVCGGDSRAANPERIAVRAGLHDTFARLVFDWPGPVGHSTALDGRTLTITFDRPMVAAFDDVRSALAGQIAGIVLDRGGRTITAKLRRDFTVRSFTAGNRIVIDLVWARPPDGPDRAGAPNAAAAPVRSGPAKPSAASASSHVDTTAESSSLTIRAEQHDEYGRLVFDWRHKVNFTVDRHGRSVTLRFDAPASVDIAALQAALPSQVSEATVRQSAQGLELALVVKPGAQLRYFHNRTAVVLDVVAPQRKGAPTVQVQSGAAGGNGTLRPKAAQAKVRPPLPPLVTVDATRIGPDSEIRFNWRQSVPAAVFTREGRLWVVFGRSARFDLGPLRVIGGAAFAKVDQHIGTNSVHVRLPLPTGYNVSVRRDGTIWVITMGPVPRPAIRPIGMKVATGGDSGSTLELLTGPGNSVVTLRDPVVGDAIVAVATSSPGVGVRLARRFAEFALPRSEQGVAVLPRQDSIKVEAGRDRVVVRQPGGLNITPVDENRLAAVDESGRSLIVDLARWSLGPDEDYHDVEVALLHNTRLPKGVQRNAARLGLSRFYASHGMGAEALGVIAAMLRDDPTMIREPAIRALRGVARFIAHEYAGAESDLNDPSLAGMRELYPWRAGIAAARGDWVSAHRLFRDTDSVIAGMPPRFAVALGLLAAEAALSVDDLDVAQQRLAALSGLPASSDQLDQIGYLRGHLLRKRDKVSRALAQWREIAENGGREGRAKSRFAAVNTELSLNMIKPKEAIEQLEKLRFAWRDDVFEFDLLHTLGRLYAKVGDLRDALVTLRSAATYFKDIKGAQTLTADMRKLFRKFYLDGAADKLPPVTALGLYQEFRELTPSGQDGDRMIRRLAERLISVDLLSQAADLLDHQVRFRLTGEAKARTGVRLAQVLLSDRKPADAVAALDNSRIDGMPAPLARDRRFLRARALLAMGQPKNALDTIAADHNDRSDMLRAQIYWHSNEWDKARLVLARLTGGFDPDALDDKEAQLLLRRAVALRLAHNNRGIAFLRKRFAAGMAKTKAAAAFEAVVGRPVTEGENFEALARQAAELDTFVAFLDALRGKPARHKPVEAAGAS